MIGFCNIYSGMELDLLGARCHSHNTCKFITEATIIHFSSIERAAFTFRAENKKGTLIAWVEEDVMYDWTSLN
jgi:hypothetical protein